MSLCSVSSKYLFKYLHVTECLGIQFDGLMISIIPLSVGFIMQIILEVNHLNSFMPVEPPKGPDILTKASVRRYLKMIEIEY